MIKPTKSIIRYLEKELTSSKLTQNEMDNLIEQICYIFGVSDETAEDAIQILVHYKDITALPLKLKCQNQRCNKIFERDDLVVVCPDCGKPTLKIDKDAYRYRVNITHAPTLSTHELSRPLKQETIRKMVDAWLQKVGHDETVSVTRSEFESVTHKLCKKYSASYRFVTKILNDYIRKGRIEIRSDFVI